MKKMILTALSLMVIVSVSAQDSDECGFYTHNVTTPPALKLKTSVVKQDKGRYDFSWLNKEVKDKKVVLIGESHWMNNLKKAGTDMVLHLNTIDHFPLLVLEMSYPVTPFINQYIDCTEPDCQEHMKPLRSIFDTKEEVQFLNKLKAWNTAHPNKKITVACSDFEQNFSYTFKYVYMPFFNALGHTNFRDRVIKDQQNQDAVLAYIDSLITAAPAGFALQSTPAVNTAFVRAAFDNLKGAVRAQEAANAVQQAGKSENESTDAFMRVRTESIIENPTDEAKLGKMFREQKSILWGGSSHVRTHQLSDDEFFKFEGWYLANDYEPTKGKVLSVSMMNLAYNIPAAYYTSEVYKKGVPQFASLVEQYKACAPAPADGKYTMVEGTTAITNAVRLAFKKHNDQPVWFRGNGEMAKLAKKDSTAAEDRYLKRFASYDYVMVLPYDTLFEYVE